MIGGGKVRPDPSKIQAVRDYPTPTSKKDIRAVLGLTGYYKKFIPQFATLAAPLADLTRNCQPEKIKWNSASAEAFQELKAVLQESLNLKVAEPDLPFIYTPD